MSQSRHARAHTADTRLSEDDKHKWLKWTKINVERHWDDPDGPIMTADVIVIDDPQGASVWSGINVLIGQHLRVPSFSTRA